MGFDVHLPELFQHFDSINNTAGPGYSDYNSFGHPIRLSFPIR